MIHSQHKVAQRTRLIALPLLENSDRFDFLSPTKRRRSEIWNYYFSEMLTTSLRPRERALIRNFNRARAKRFASQHFFEETPFAGTAILKISPNLLYSTILSSIKFTTLLISTPGFLRLTSWHEQYEGTRNWSSTTSSRWLSVFRVRMT